jgi:N-methylhydantoinase B
MIEATSPLLVEEWSLVTDSGGAGRRRGGLTSRRVYRVEYDEATFTVSGERGRSAPEGHFGGQPGTRFQCVVERADGSEHKVAAKGGQTVVYRGDRVTVQPAGSGGYGDPGEREQTRIDADVADGYISADAAAQLYGQRHHAAPEQAADAPLEVAAP